MIGAFYDCVLLYAYSLNKTLSEGGDPMNGRAIARQIWNTTFLGGNALSKCLVCDMHLNTLAAQAVSVSFETFGMKEICLFSLYHYQLIPT